MYVVIREKGWTDILCQTAVLICSSLPNTFMLINPEPPLEITIAVFTLKLLLEMLMFRMNRCFSILMLPGLLWLIKN